MQRVRIFIVLSSTNVIHIAMKRACAFDCKSVGPSQSNGSLMRWLLLITPSLCNSNPKKYPYRDLWSQTDRGRDRVHCS